MAVAAGLCHRFFFCTTAMRSSPGCSPSDALHAISFLTPGAKLNSSASLTIATSSTLQAEGIHEAAQRVSFGTEEGCTQQARSDGKYGKRRLSFSP